MVLVIAHVCTIIQSNLLLVLEEELQVDLENSLEKTHVGTLVQTNLMFPYIDNQDLAGGQRKESTLSLEVLVLTALSTIGTLNVHDKDVVGHLGACTRLSLVLGHPDTLCGLATLGFRHDRELGAEEVVEQGGLSGRLGAEDGDEVVIEARIGNIGCVEILADMGAVTS
jgi:hypothetical protein